MLDVTKYPPSAHGFTCRNCGGGDRGRVAIYRPFGEVSLSLNRTVTCMVLKANDRRTSCPCHDEFRGPRSDYVRQVALATTTELMACCVGARLVNSILKALNMPDLKVTLWSDSTTALWWMKEYGNWSVFVANRVKEIRQLTQIQSWKYVPGNMNIADLLSRGCSPPQVLNSRWWEGPSCLKQNSEYWPDGEISCEPQEVNVERKKTKNANVDLANDAPPLLVCNVSDYDKMIRVFAWILRFVNNCRKDYNKCKEHELSVAEIENSEKQLIRLSQTYYLPDVESL
ncbi:integrase_H2C2 domain-containing protein [Trichonephila clavipes]|nr:integrase_H2C2 domain-containing protein [Trichonephila clavipes]